MTARSLALAVAIVVVPVVEGAAQTGQAAPHLRPGRPSITVGGVLSGGYPVGEATASLRQNAPGTTSPPPFTLFRSSTEMNRAAGVDARVAWPLSASVAIEVGGAFSRPGLTVSIDGDAESSRVTLDQSRLEQYAIEAAVVWQVSRLALGSRARPYLSVGGGYLRQLYDDRTLVETGQLFHVGAGVRYWLRGGQGLGRDLGVRGEVRYALRREGVELAGQSRRYPGATLSLFVGL